MKHSAHHWSAILPLGFALLCSGCFTPLEPERRWQVHTPEQDKSDLLPYHQNTGKSLHIIFVEAPYRMTHPMPVACLPDLTFPFRGLGMEIYGVLVLPESLVVDTVAIPGSLVDRWRYDADTDFWKKYLAGAACDEATFDAHLTDYCKPWLYGRIRTSELREEQLLQLVHRQLFLCPIAERDSLPPAVAEAIQEQIRDLERREAQAFWKKAEKKRQAEDGSSWLGVEFMLIRNEATPTSVLVKIVKAHPKGIPIMYNMVQRPHKDLALLQAIVESGNEAAQCSLAEQKTTPLEILRILEASPSPKLATELAKNPRTSGETLGWLAKRPEIEQAIASRTPVGDQAMMRWKEPEKLRPFDTAWALAQNPSTPPEVLRQLNHPPFQEPVFSNPSTPVDILMDAARHYGQNPVQTLKSNPNLPPEAILALAEQNVVLLSHPNTPVSLLEKTYKDPGLSRETRFRIAEAPNTPDAILLEMAAGKPELLRTIADRKNLSPAVAKSLYDIATRMRDEAIRKLIQECPRNAGYSATSKETQNLYETAQEATLVGLAENQATPAEILRQMAVLYGEEKYHRGEIPFQLDCYINERNIYGIAHELAKNPQTPADCFKFLAHENLGPLLKHPAVSRELLLDIIHDPKQQYHSQDIVEILRHPKLTLADLQVLQKELQGPESPKANLPCPREEWFKPLEAEIVARKKMANP